MIAVPPPFQPTVVVIGGGPAGLMAADVLVASGAAVTLYERMPSLEDAWRWNPEQLLLRDYYAGALLTYEEVKQRGWPERRRSDAKAEAISAAAAAQVSSLPQR